MSTILDPRPPRRPAPRSRGVRIDARLLAWPLGLLALLVVLAVWRTEGAASSGADAAGAPTPVPTEQRRFGALRLDVPRTWITLDRSPTHVTWGSPDRRHTVTLAGTEASVLPLPGVVAAVIEESEHALPGTHGVGRVRTVELDARAPRADAALAARFEVREAGSPALEVVQVWRRDSRAGQDLVATWTSADGRWPVPLQRGIPRASASR